MFIQIDKGGLHAIHIAFDARRANPHSHSHCAFQPLIAAYTFHLEIKRNAFCGSVTSRISQAATHYSPRARGLHSVCQAIPSLTPLRDIHNIASLR